MYAGRAAGIDVTEDDALRWITANPAWVLGIDDVIGTLEAGKRADVVLWSGSPFSVYSQPEVVIQAGEVAFRARRRPGGERLRARQLGARRPGGRSARGRPGG